VTLTSSAISSPESTRPVGLPISQNVPEKSAEEASRRAKSKLSKLGEALRKVRRGVSSGEKGAKLHVAGVSSGKEGVRSDEGGSAGGERALRKVPRRGTAVAKAMWGG